MKTLKLYHISTKFLGTNPVLQPNIPDLMNGDIEEDQHTPRICCALSVLNCIRSKELVFQDDIYTSKLVVYAYTADVPVGKVYQPALEEVPDAWITDEFWLKQPTQFEFEGTYVIRKHMDIGDMYSRYAVTKLNDSFTAAVRHDFDDYDEVVDRVVATCVYGDPEAFSFIDVDSMKRNEFFTNCIGTATK